MPPVSVVMPAFNAAGVVGEALESIQRQTFRNFEAIIVDDGSTDNTAEVVRRFCEMDSRFKLVSQSNAGRSAARNQGILNARGEWIAFLDADDFWFPHKLERQMAISREDPRANFLFTNFYLWDGERDLRLWYPDGQPLPEGDPTRQLIFDFTYLPSTVMVRRGALREAGPFDLEMRMAEDWDMWLRVAERGIWARGVREPLARYRRWPGSVTVANRLKSVDYHIRVFRKRLRETPRVDLIPLYRRSLAEMQVHTDMMCMRRLVETNPAAIRPLVWHAWRRQRRLKWLRWYLLLTWPKFLGGNAARQNVYRKIQNRWRDVLKPLTTEPPLVSVVVPVWNGAVFLLEALRSVQAQTHKKFEAIIVDDGSTDETATVARGFCETDSRFVFLRQPHAGVSAARNAALAGARGQYVAFLDADDVWLPQKLEHQLALFAGDPRVNAVFANFYVWDGARDLRVWHHPNKSFPAGDVARRLIFSIGLVCPTMSAAVFRRELLRDVEFFDSELAIGEDWDLLLRMAECGLWARITREPLARYRRWDGNTTNQKLKMAEANVAIVEKNSRRSQRPELRPVYERSFARARARLELARARQFVESQPAAVPAAIWRAWRLQPREFQWLLRLALVKWPKFLGGGVTARLVHRKLIQKF